MGDLVRVLFFILVAGLAFIVSGIRKLLHSRRRITKLQKAGLPMPKHNFLTGHLLEMKRYMDTVPSDSTINTTIAAMAHEFPGGVFYIDLWPFTKPLLISTTPSSGYQLQQHALDKPKEISDAFWHLTGGPNLFTMPETPWKPWRTILNPAFSPAHILTLSKTIATEMQVFCEILEEKAHRGSIFQLEDLTLKLTVDVIVAVALNTRLHYQQKENALASSLRTLIEWTSFGDDLNPFTRYNPLRPLVQFYLSRKLNNLIEVEIDRQYSELLEDQSLSKETTNSKSIMYLTLQNYLNETKKSKETQRSTSKGLDRNFKNVAAAQIRLFLVAGHDTTSSTLLYCYYLLGTSPDAMRKIREEHENVFGSTDVYNAISQDATCLNRLPYTSAVIKEAGRLFPAASAMRGGVPGVSITDDDGREFPSDGCSIWVIHLLLHRNPKYWKDPHAFIPERWLIEDPKDPLHPVKGAWRPFEFGPRNCIGQSLATLEMRIALAMTIRKFDIKPAYDEWDKIHKNTRKKIVFGTRAYQVQGGGGGAHPSAGLPCEVFVRNG